MDNFQGESKMLKTKFYERALRSLGKVVTWRILVTITNFVGGWLASGSWQVGLGVVSFALVVNSILYFFHERLWNCVDAGKEINDQNT
jgi:uncharacterized membrane protein